jgi:hypothetical protein
MIKARSTVKSLQGLRDLCKYIKNTKEMSIIEIGSFSGESSEIFAQNFKEVWCVDPWGIKTADPVLKPFIKDAEIQFNKLCKKYPNIKKVKEYSIKLSEIINRTFDVIYIDGLHDYKNVFADIKAWKPYIKKHIAGHDYRKNKFPGVIKAVNQALGKPDKVFCDFSWIKKVK